MTPYERKLAIIELDHRLLDTLGEYISAIRAKKSHDIVKSLLASIENIKWQIFKMSVHK